MSCFVQIILNPFSQTELSMSLFLFLVKYNWMQLKAVFSVFKSYTYCFSYVPLCSTLLQNMAAQNSKFLSHSWADGLCFVEIFHIIFLVVVSRRGVGWHHERFNWDAHLRDDFFPHEWVLTGVGWGRELELLVIGQANLSPCISMKLEDMAQSILGYLFLSI